MDLKEIMEQKRFAVVGDTLNSEKYAYKIKVGLENKGYDVYPVGKEIASLNDISGNLDIIDLCINPVKGLSMIKECVKTFKCIVIQPGAESEELLEYLKQNNIPYIEGCLLVGLSLYAK
ncbi:MAG: CoA-binding protein [Aminipila sp.]